MARSRSSKGWLHEHVTDPYVRRARSQGFRSRAAYKLQQIADRDRLFSPGMTVVDLGAAPGGWSQIAATAVAPRGRVIAVDLLEMAALPGVTLLRGDFGDEAVLSSLERQLHGKHVDIVLSDMAPNISGVASADQARAVALAEFALEFALKHLKPQGKLLVKAFHGAGFEGLLRTMRQGFSKVVIRKPEASRSRSSEVYLLGSGVKGA
ncbi:MAG: RlmE family RNA methyltransferase [Betaproteobacteria bacterium]